VPLLDRLISGSSIVVEDADRAGYEEKTQNPCQNAVIAPARIDGQE
jgi:hypothetical protein